MALDLPDDLQSVELLSQTLLGPEEDELDKILSQLPAVESFEQYFPHSSGNQEAVPNTKIMDRCSESCYPQTETPKKYQLGCYNYCVAGLEQVKISNCTSRVSCSPIHTGFLT